MPENEYGKMVIKAVTSEIKKAARIPNLILEIPAEIQNQNTDYAEIIKKMLVVGTKANVFTKINADHHFLLIYDFEY